MLSWSDVHLIRRSQFLLRRMWDRKSAALLALLLVTPLAALAQGSPFDTGFNAIQALFTGTIAKVASPVAVVIGGYGFAHGEPGAKKVLAGVAAGTGVAVLAVNVLSWLWGTAIARLFRDPEGAVGELKSQFANDSMKTLLLTHIERELQRLDQHVQGFTRQPADFMRIEVLNQQGQFTFFRRLLNYDDWRISGGPQSTQFLDYQVVNFDIEAERDQLRAGDHIVRVLTMKEAITETRPFVLDALLKIPANFYVVTEWTPLLADRAHKEVNKGRRHFNMSKTGFVSQMGNDATQTNPRDVLVDESKQADIENLGDCLRALGDGQSLGNFSLTIVWYGGSPTELDQLVAEFTGIFTNADGNLFTETYNQLNAYFATVPSNYAFQLRQLYLLDTNYADLSFLFTVLPGEKTNAHLGTDT
jgi:type IV secretory pathway VirB2 component (pilin)